MKKSFKDHCEGVGAELHNSHLTNLAQALMYVEAGLTALGKLEEEITTLAEKIENGRLVEVTEVKALFDKARRGEGWSCDG